MSATDDRSTATKRAYLEELKALRIALKRQYYTPDVKSSSLSNQGGSISSTNRESKEIKDKIADIESEIAALCRELGEPLPFATRGGVKTITVRFC